MANECLSNNMRIVCMLAGLALIVVGALVQVSLQAYVDFFGYRFSAAAIVLIVIGVLLFVIGFFGCCGACTEQQCMVMTFAFLLGLALVAEIAVIIASYVLRDEINGFMNEKMEAGAMRYNVTESSTELWDIVQHDFECCGVSDHTTWEHLSPNLPDSCCKVETTSCGVNGFINYDPEIFFDHGCVHKMQDYVSARVLIIGGVGIALAVIQLIGIILACCLAKAIRKGYHMV